MIWKKQLHLLRDLLKCDLYTKTKGKHYQITISIHVQSRESLVLVILTWCDAYNIRAAFQKRPPKGYI